MPDMWIDVDAAVTVPVNVLPLLDATDFKTIEEAVAYDAAGMDLNWNFVTSAGVVTQTNVVPTTAGVYDWTHVGNGIYKIEIPASGGASINNDTEGYGWFSGVCTGVLPWTGPRIGFRASALNDLLCDSAYSATRGLAGTALPNAAADAAGGLPISDAGGLDMDNILALAASSAAWGSINSGIVFRGTVTAADPGVSFTIAGLAAQGAGAFIDATTPWYAYVFRDAGGAGAAPQGEQQQVTGYTSATGLFTTTAFTVPVAVGDNVIVMSGRIASVPEIKTRVELALPNAAPDAAGGLPVSDAGGLDLDTILGRITANVALASVCTEGRLAELDAANLPTDVAAIAGYLDTEVAAILTDTGTTIPALIAALNDLSAADVNAQVLDVLNVDTFPQPGQETPAATQTLVKMLAHLYKAWRNAADQNSTLYQLYNDDGVTVDQKAAISDDSTTTTRSEVVAGP
jgi:hypothetical protein